jgi:DNA damage-inducible protein 1
MRTHSTAAQQQQQQQPSSQLNAQAEAFRQQVMHDRRVMSEIQDRDPSLALAIATGDLAVIGRFLRARQEAEMARRRELEQLHADPFNIDNQRRIEELIRSEQVHENYEHAIEHNPAAFAQVSMLYINVKVNNVPVKAFVDSGAQMTIMSPDMARRCNVGHLIDTRFQGMAVGVGSQRILGRVHMMPLTIEGESYPCMVTVLERDNMDFLLGLDMLKAHRAIIDLKDNVLRIGTVTTPFLGESEIPRGSIGGKEMATEPNHPSSSSSSTSSSSAATNSVVAAEKLDSADSAANATNRQCGGGGSAPSEANIATLVGLGATREEAIQLLRAANNNVDVAAGMMF